MASLRWAIKRAEQTMGRPVKSVGYEERVIANHVVNVLYFSCESSELGMQYRWQVFIDGKTDAGGIIGYA